MTHNKVLAKQAQFQFQYQLQFSLRTHSDGAVRGILPSNRQLSMIE